MFCTPGSTDGILVRDGGTSQNRYIQQIYGCEVPDPVLSLSSSSIYLQFYSNGAEADSGFLATFTSEGLCKQLAFLTHK